MVVMKKKQNVNERDRLELATARAKPEQTVTMDKGVINTQTPREVAVANKLEQFQVEKEAGKQLYNIEMKNPGSAALFPKGQQSLGFSFLYYKVVFLLLFLLETVLIY